MKHSPGKKWAVPAAALVLALSIGSVSWAVTSTSTTTGASGTTAATSPDSDAGGNPWANQRSDETVLTGDTLAKVKAAALAKVGSDATVVRAETDADGHAAYEAHMQKADGTRVTVYVDGSFNVVSVEDQPAGGPTGGP